MKTFRIAWQIEGATEVEAENPTEARQKFNGINEETLARRDAVNLEVLAIAPKVEAESLTEATAER